METVVKVTQLCEVCGKIIDLDVSDGQFYWRDSSGAAYGRDLPTNARKPGRFWEYSGYHAHVPVKTK